MLPEDAKTIPDGWKAALVALQESDPFIYGTAPPVLDDDFNESDIPVFEDTFNRTDPAPWVPGANTALSIANKRLSVGVLSDGIGRAVLSEPLPSNSWVQVTTDLVQGGGVNNRILISQNLDGSSPTLIDTYNAPAATDDTFVVPTGTWYLVLDTNAGVAGQFSLWDNVTIDEVPALAGWIPAQTAAPLANISIVERKMRSTSPGTTAGKPGSQKEFTVEVGKDYIVSGELNRGPGQVANARSIIAAGGTGSFETASETPVEYAYSFTATATTVTLLIDNNSVTTAAGEYVESDNITVQQTLVENGTFDSDIVGWTIENPALNQAASVDGALQITGTDDFNGVYQEVNLIGGETYKFQWDAQRPTANVFQFEIRDSSGSLSWDDGSPSSGSITDNGIVGQWKTFTRYYTPPADTLLRMRPNQSNVTAEAMLYDNVIIKAKAPLTEEDYQRNDWWYAWLGAQGYTGSMNDRELAYWTDQLPTPIVVNNYGPGYGPGYQP